MPNVLVFTSLFPNKVNPDFGVFIKKRMFAYAKRKDCNVMVVAPVPFSPDVKFFKKYYQYSQIPRHELIDGIMVYHPRYPLIPKISMTVHGKLIYHSTINTLKQINKEFPFDLIDAHFIYPDCQAGVLLGNYFKKPVIVSARGTDINQYIFIPSIKPQIVKTLQRATRIVSVCRALKDMMIGLGIDDRKIDVIPNGIDKDLFYPIDRRDARNALGLPPEKRIILSVGSLIPRKGHDLTIRALNRLIGSMSDLQLYILGTGDEKSNLESLISGLNMKDVVFLKGHIRNKELLTWYNASDIFCLSSEKEGWANVLMESLACGTPVVATNVFGAPEIVRNDSLGLLVERTDNDIAGGIEAALNKKWDHGEISRQIRERTWNIVAEEVSHVFDSALERFRVQERRKHVE